ncbi:MAG TPA: putative toxin-antitoxin system toxin component, PIN family [Anaerolineae bacterium]|nr:putative toxin-antitoxin system toxin component, PIN family [Anaerolineae bacterium]
MPSWPKSSPMSPFDQPSLRVVVDANVLVRGTLSATGGSALALEAIKRRRCVLITSRQHLSGLYDVLGRSRITRKYGVTDKERQRLVGRLYAGAILVTPIGTLSLCRDPKDDYLLELALLGQATHLVTEDDDLHGDPAIRSVFRDYGVRLVHVAQFLVDLASASQSTPGE